MSCRERVQLLDIRGAARDIRPAPIAGLLHNY